MNAQTLLQIVVALAIAHMLHAIFELGHIGSKLKRLHMATDGKPLPKYPYKIDTRGKAYGLNFSFLIVAFLICYFIISVLYVSPEMCAWIAIGTTLAIELINVVGYDRYHVGIEKLIRKFSE